MRCDPLANSTNLPRSMHETSLWPGAASLPLDQAAGLRQLFAHARVRFIPVVSNPHMAFGGVLLERLCTAFAGQGAQVLLVDAGEHSPAASEMALIDLRECIEPLLPQLSYLAARGLHLHFCDAQGSTAGLLNAVSDAAPQADVVLVHAPAADLCRIFARRGADDTVRPLLLAEDRPASVTHAYAAMKLLVARAGLMVHELLLGAASGSPRAARIAQQISSCADNFIGALLRDWAQVDPASQAGDETAAALRRIVRARLQPLQGETPAEAFAAGFARCRTGAAALDAALN